MFLLSFRKNGSASLFLFSFFFNEETLLIEEVFCSYQFLTKVVDSKQQVVPANFPGQWSCPGQRMRMLVM